MCIVFQFVPQAGLSWKVPGFTPLGLVGHLDRCLSVPALHWLWGIYPIFVDWIAPVTKPGQLRMPVCHTAHYRLAVFTVLPYTGGQCDRYTSSVSLLFPPKVTCVKTIRGIDANPASRDVKNVFRVLLIFAHN